ncbi:MAG: (2Fe-2S)-binding protein [Erysipelotrichaceae bacterium]|nr:(2Fe-2S)-binding protein [Erysipelotrichaceae bacterium]
MDSNETVCFCLGVTKQDIKEAIDAGATTLEAIQEKTGAGTACGGCISKIEEILEELK